ncbi:MAG: hypothetical protein FWD57_10040 [Polyangiaceae bacterium]|nr:hypothetical protein [Polyangiaceae bacterium]
MLLLPELINNEIEQAATKFHQGLRSGKLRGWGQLEPNPLAAYRNSTTKQRFEQIKEIHDDLPIKEALLQWQACITIERVTWDDRIAAEAARHKQEHRIPGLGDLPWSVHSLVVELLQAKDQSKRTAIADGLARVSADASMAAIEWALRRQAAARYLGIGNLDWLETPARDLSMTAVAKHVLDITEDAAMAVISSDRGWGDALWSGTAADAEHGWPTTLSPKWFRNLFGDWKPLQGIRVEPGPSCSPICGASFARALAKFGSAMYLACATRECHSFCLAHRPFDMAKASYGTLFASLLTSIPFLKRRMGLGASAACHQAKSLGASMLLSLRTIAAQTAVASTDTSDALLQAHVEFGSRAFLSRVQEETAGVLPRYNPESAAGLCGALRAAGLERRLVDVFDDDWFDNPRAHQYLTAIDISSRVVLDGVGLSRGIDALQESLLAVLVA